jgi:hypothetical protein
VTPLRPEDVPQPGLLDRLRGGAYLNSAVFPDLQWIVPSIIPEGLTVLIGPPKIGKSWMAYGLALAVSTGGRAFGRIPVGPARPVLYLALEDGDRRMQARGRQLLEGDPFPEMFHYLLTVEPLRIVETIADWLAMPEVRKHPQPPLVLLDTLGKVMPDARKGETPYMRDYRITGSLHAVCQGLRPGMGLVILHHDRKAQADDFVDSVSGTNGIAGAADTIIALGRKRLETDGLLKVTGRDVDEDEYALEMLEGRWSLQGDLEEAKERARALRAVQGHGGLYSQVYAYVQAHPDGCTPAEISTALGADPRVVSNYLRRMVQADEITSPIRGTYVP